MSKAALSKVTLLSSIYFFTTYLRTLPNHLQSGSGYLLPRHDRAFVE
jgi:hypothetical protein